MVKLGFVVEDTSEGFILWNAGKSTVQISKHFRFLGTVQTGQQKVLRRRGERFYWSAVKMVKNLILMGTGRRLFGRSRDTGKGSDATAWDAKSGFSTSIQGNQQTWEPYQTAEVRRLI